MKYSVERRGDDVVIVLDGQLNYASSLMFRGVIADVTGYEGKRVVFDLEKISHIDSVGLGLLYIAKDEFSQAKGRLILKSPHDNVLKMLELTETGMDFEIQN